MQTDAKPKRNLCRNSKPLLVRLLCKYFATSSITVCKYFIPILSRPAGVQPAPQAGESPAAAAAAALSAAAATVPAAGAAAPVSKTS